MLKTDILKCHRERERKKDRDKMKMRGREKQIAVLDSETLSAVLHLNLESKWEKSRGGNMV